MGFVFSFSVREELEACHDGLNAPCQETFGEYIRIGTFGAPMEDWRMLQEVETYGTCKHVTCNMYHADMPSMFQS